MNYKTHVFFLLSIFLSILSQTGSSVAQPPACDITWRRSDGARVITGIQTVPAGQHVCVEPGVVVQFASDGKLNVLGRITAVGTAQERISITGLNVFPNRVEIGGVLDLRYADITVPLNLNANSSFDCRECRFGARGMVTTQNGLTSWFTPGTRFIWLENVLFDAIDSPYNSDLYVSNVTAVLRNVAFRNKAQLNVRDSYLKVENVTSENSNAAGLQLAQGHQPQFLDNISVTNSFGAGLHLHGGNFEIGPNVTIQNAQYPVAGGGGLLAGSNIPVTGNRNNWIEAGQPATGSVYAPVGLPYVVSGQSIIGGVEFVPGVVLKARSTFGFTAGSPLRALGLPNAPVTIEPFDPSQKWLAGKMDASGSRMEYVVFDGSQHGIAGEGGANVSYNIDNSLIRNHNKAITSPQYQLATLRGNLFTNNGVAVDLINSGIQASGKTNPNLFENNTIAVRGFQSNDFRHNWWNSPTGPTAPNNPGGTGDVVTGSTNIAPFRTIRPDRSDHPPVVRMGRIYHNIRDAGSKLILTWSGFDNAGIVKQKVLFSTDGNLDRSFSVIADNLPPSQRAYELKVPSVGFQASGNNAFVRVVAVDDKGQEGWDEWQIGVPSDEITYDLQITSQVAGQTFRGNHAVPLNWTVISGDPSVSLSAYLILDADHRVIPLGGGTQTGAASTPVMPNVSTDSARFLVIARASRNRLRWFVSPPFSIRPDARYPDGPPQISVSSPQAGQTFAAGSVVPISWMASDDEALRRFDIMASTDGGRSWSFIAENLAPGTTNFNWQLPPGSSIPDVRVRVIAVDRRFQNSSDGGTRVFHIVRPATAPPSVQITYPANNSSSAVGTSVFIGADAADSDGTIQRVDFYASANHVGQPSRTLLASDTSAPYQIGWDLLFSGNFVLTAEAIDNSGMVSTSAPVNFTVPQSGGPLPIGPPQLTSPAHGQIFAPGSSITLSAVTSTGGVEVERMEFYSGTQLIASDNQAPFSVVWNTVPVGRHTVSVKAVSGGAESLSSHIDIVVGTAQPVRRVPFDFDGDGKTDIGIFRPVGAFSEWWINRSSNGQTFALQFGASTDRIAPADYTGDGKADIAFFRPVSGEWYVLRSEDFSFFALPFGANGDIPVPADYDADGKADFAVFRPSNSTWYISQSSGAPTRIEQFGAAGDQPVASDYDGDGKADVGIFRPAASGAEWWINRSTAGVLALQFGAPTDKPAQGDYTGDGKTDIAIWRPSTGAWLIVRSEDLSFYGFPFGASGDVIAPGDYDGDGKFDPTVFRPSSATWFIARTTAGTHIVQFGANGDQPMANAFVP